MSANRTHYDVLGLSRDAPAEDIEANYRLRLAQLKGRAGASAADVVALRQAHHALADPARRAEYDRSLAAPRRPRAVFVPVPPSTPREISFWHSTPVMVAGLLVMAGIGAWGWSHWQKKAPAPRKASAPAMAKPAPRPPRPAPRSTPSTPDAAPAATRSAPSPKPAPSAVPKPPVR